MTDKERIEKEAIEYVIRATGYQVLSEHDHWKEAYIAGATAERQKAWNEAIDAVKDMLVVQMEDEENEGLAALHNAYRKLEELKHKQP